MSAAETRPALPVDVPALLRALEAADPPRCMATVPPPHAQADARCEREPHATGNHKVSARDGLPGAVWSDARSREDGGS